MNYQEKWDGMEGTTNPHYKTTLWQPFSKDFSDMALNMDRFWRNQGIEWRFGIEHEYRFRAETSDHDIKRYLFDLRKQRENLIRLEDKNPEKFKQKIADFRSKHHIRFGATTQPRSDDEATTFYYPEHIEDEIAHLNSILKQRAALKNELDKHFENQAALFRIQENETKASEAIAKQQQMHTFNTSQLIMCAMHELWMPDLLEYRFGNEGGGKGYYDVKDSAEVRTKPLSVTEALTAYNRIIHRLTLAAYDYGTVVSHLGNPHVHFSARDMNNEQPLTAIGNKMVAYTLPSGEQRKMNQTEFFKRTAEGAYLLEINQMALVDRIQRSHLKNFIPVMSFNRTAFRLFDNRIEYRTTPLPIAPPQKDISLYIAHLLAGATYGLTGETFEHERTKLDTLNVSRGDYKSAIGCPEKEAADNLCYILNKCIMTKIKGKNCYRIRARRNFDSYLGSDEQTQIFGASSPENMQQHIQAITADCTDDGKIHLKYTGICQPLSTLLQSIQCQSISNTFVIGKINLQDKNVISCIKKFYQPDILMGDQYESISNSPTLPSPEDLDLKKAGQKLFQNSPAINEVYSQWARTGLREEIVKSFNNISIQDNTVAIDAYHGRLRKSDIRERMNAKE